MAGRASDRRLEEERPRRCEVVLLQPFGTVDETAPADKASRAELATSFQMAITGGPLSLRPLEAGEDAWVQDIPCAARVLSPGQQPCSFVVETPNGVVQRNCSHLVPFTPSRPSKPVRFLSATPGQSSPIGELQASPLTVGSSDDPSASIIPGITRSPIMGGE
ncbi:hypothetical protein HPB47_003337 [Ixodes persulcatus]|uniref:Uncharacterized protein n=1 Tax=Ixodes persulcatus TaxID=34615 RepID=A0AC60PIS8_IXOPE|nr:hypothetical protein HPB47_003337 [Ixodes persulcatus]